MPDFISKEKLGEIIASDPTFATPEGKRGVVKNLIAKGHEIEGINANFSPLETVKNIPGSTIELGKNIYAAFANPLQSAKALGSVALGGLQKLVPGEQDNEKSFNRILDFYEQRYGSTDKFLNTVEKDPVGFATDLSSLLSGGGAILKGGAKVASLAGGTGVASKLATAGKVASTIGSAVDPLSLAGGVASGATKLAIRPINETLGINRLLNDASGRIMQTALGFTKSQAANLAKKTFMTKSPGERLAEWGITGTPEQISQQLGDVIGKTKSTVDTALSGIKTNYQSKSIKNVLTSTEDLLDGVKSKKLQAQQSRIKDLIAKHDAQGLTLSEVNEAKRALESLQAEAIYKVSGEYKGALQKKDLGNQLAEVRRIIETQAEKNGIKNIRELNNQTQFAFGAKKVLDDNIRAGYHRSSLIDRIMTGTAAGATIWSLNNPKFLIGALGIYVPLKLLRSESFRTQLATKIKLLTEGEYKALEGGVRLNKVTSPARQVVRRAFSSLRRIYPEIRLTGVVENNTKDSFDRQTATQ